MNTTHDPMPQPRTETGTGELPSALTFFVTRAQRRDILRTLGLLSDNRGRALMIALGLIDAGEGVGS